MKTAFLQTIPGHWLRIYIAEKIAKTKKNTNIQNEFNRLVKEKATISAIPEIKANHPESNLIHEAAIGKIAGEQLIKLMSLGLTEKEAENQIINGFLK